MYSGANQKHALISAVARRIGLSGKEEGDPCVVDVSVEEHLCRTKGDGRLIVDWSYLVHYNVGWEAGSRSVVAEAVILAWFDHQGLGCMPAVGQEVK